MAHKPGHKKQEVSKLRRSLGRIGDTLEKWVEPAVEIGKWIPGPQQPFVLGADIAFDLEDMYSEAYKGNYGKAALEGVGLLGNPMAGRYVEGTKLGEHVPDALTQLDKIPTSLTGGLIRGGSTAVSELAKRNLRGGNEVAPAGGNTPNDDWQSFANAYQADAMQGANAVGQQMGQSFNRRGLGGSPLAAGLQSQAMTQAMGRVQSELGKMRLSYMQNQDRLGLQERQLGLQERQLENQEQAESNKMLMYLTDVIGKIGGSNWAKENVWDKLSGGSLSDLDVLGGGTGAGGSDYGTASMASPAPALAPMPDFGLGDGVPDRTDIVTRNQVAGVSDRIQELIQGKEEGWDSPVNKESWANWLDGAADKPPTYQGQYSVKPSLPSLPQQDYVPEPSQLPSAPARGLPPESRIAAEPPPYQTVLRPEGYLHSTEESSQIRPIFDGDDRPQAQTPADWLSRLDPRQEGRDPLVDIPFPPKGVEAAKAISRIRAEAVDPPTIRNQEWYTHNPDFRGSIDKRVRKLDSFTEAAAKEHNVPADLLRAMIYVESGGKVDAESPAGALGPLQLMGPTAKAMGVTDRLDPRQNIFGGAKYLAKMLKRYDNDLEQALAAYNMGPTALDSGRKWSSETRKYLPKVINLYLRYQKRS